MNNIVILLGLKLLFESISNEIIKLTNKFQTWIFCYRRLVSLIYDLFAIGSL
jgi:hypothetical protein